MVLFPYGAWATGNALNAKFWSILSIGMSKLGWLVKLKTSKLYFSVIRSLIGVTFTIEMSARFCQDCPKMLRCPPPEMKLVSNVSPGGIALLGVVHGSVHADLLNGLRSRRGDRFADCQINRGAALDRKGTKG